MYLIIKQGAYENGVYWIGEDKDTGVKECVELARNDSSSSKWVLCRYISDKAPNHEIVVSLRKKMQSSPVKRNCDNCMYCFVEVSESFYTCINGESDALMNIEDFRLEEKDCFVEPKK